MTTLRVTLAVVFAALLPAGGWGQMTGAQCTPTILTYQPTSKEVILNTDFTQITPYNSQPINVTGGVFTFKSVLINAGVTVRGTGSKPMVWCISGDFIVNGSLVVDGTDGDRVNVLGSANFPTPGGVGNCGGGNGGRGSPNTSGQSVTGEPGFGPGQLTSWGGQGGQLSYNNTTCGRGSGGGGGTFATVGAPYFKAKAIGSSFVQQIGQGGYGCTGQSGTPTRTLPGGMPGLSMFIDNRAENDFFGTALNVAQSASIQGELPAPIGGSGGGGGGDRAPLLGSTNWVSNNKGGGGGGGGGALMIFATGTIRIGPNGLISANGGNGGGGEQAGGNNQGGGGGGGSGGLVILHSLTGIELHAHGDTYANNDYSFPLSADGGLGTQGRFGGLEWLTKYPPPGSPPNFNGALWDNAPSGALGGMGIVQMAAPTGSNSDGTNTILDDNIHFIDSTGQPMTGTEKERYLAWRGFPNAQGVWVDDYGMPTYNNPKTTPNYPAWASQYGVDSEGDIRPAPILFRDVPCPTCPGNPPTAQYQVFGTSCGNTPPILAASGGSPPRLGQQVSVTVTNLSAWQGGAFITGASNQLFGALPLPVELSLINMPGCHMYVSHELVMPFSTGLSSSYTWSVTIPNNPTLLGLEFHNQAFVFDPTANPLGIATSNAGTATIGF